MTASTKPVIVYTADWCGYCERAKTLLRQREIPFEEVNVDTEPGFRSRLMEMTGRMTVPQILIGGAPIGGFDDLRALDRTGRLDEIVRA